MTDERVYDGNTEERLTRQRNAADQTPATSLQNLPGHPHSDEPDESLSEHAIEQRLLSREVKPIGDQLRVSRGEDPFARFGRSMGRPMPRTARSARLPAMTNAGHQMNRPVRSTIPDMANIVPAPAGMDFSMPRVSAPKNGKMDPFKGLSEPFGKSKPLPEGMKMFSGRKKQKSKKANRFIW